MEHRYTKILKLSLSVLLFLAIAFLSQRIISQSLANQLAKQEYAEANHIMYGLFSINAWKEKIQVIIADEINQFDLSKSTVKQIKEQIQTQLGNLIDKVYERIRESNKGTVKGRLKQSLINAFVDIDEIKKGIPEYTDAIMKELTKSQTERKIKRMLKSGVEQYLEKTYEPQDLTPVERMVAKAGVDDIEQARIKFRDEITANEKHIYQETWAMISFAILLFAIAGFSKRPITGPLFAMLLLTLFGLLLAGVGTPMIDMEAKISELSFVLLDHQVKFEEQILFFQSKSIMDVFAIMIVHKDIQMKVVGILMVTFSVVFPMLKMLSSIVYFGDFRKLRQNKIVQFFVLKSGKWSMADVLVVAIFMAYIGFSGIISSQLAKLSDKLEEVKVMTTNGTTLEPGFYIFLTYAVLALVLSSLLKKKMAAEALQKPIEAEA